jgi:hypothetical protein
MILFFFFHNYICSKKREGKMKLAEALIKRSSYQKGMEVPRDKLIKYSKK